MFMQPPQLHRPPSKIGFGIALVSSGFSIFSMCAFSFVTTCAFDHILCTDYSLVQLFQNNPFLWIPFAAAIFTSFSALICIFLGDLLAVGRAMILTVFGLISTICLLLPIIDALNQSVTVDFGAWLCLFGMVVATIGGIIAIWTDWQFTHQNRRRPYQY